MDKPTKFRYIITDISDGCLKGTNDLIVANQFAVCEDFFVYDTKAGTWILSDLTLVEPEEAKIDPEGL